MSKLKSSSVMAAMVSSMARLASGSKFGLNGLDERRVVFLAGVEKFVGGARVGGLAGSGRDWRGETVESWSTMAQSTSSSDAVRS
jgi:hypothetical protein